MGKTVIKTTESQIAEYWMLNSTIPETELNFDWSDARWHCWNCGNYKRKGKKYQTYLQRCHIVPDSLGGNDTPSNYVLLCAECHKEAPNTNNHNDMWDWIKSNYISGMPANTYKVNRAVQMLKQRHGIDLFSIRSNANDVELAKELFANVSTHGVYINVSTFYYMLVEFCKHKDLIPK